ncbi:unnamed protein product [Meganyctiphanes norvegica]|uniref:Uncharacterized protein n=1 Tax=Meganyctiphanes norvegica TaxID=48144 RepID=A0AAV2RUI8_MEGNR
MIYLPTAMGHGFPRNTYVITDDAIVYLAQQNLMPCLSDQAFKVITQYLLTPSVPGNYAPSSVSQESHDIDACAIFHNPRRGGRLGKVSPRPRDSSTLYQPNLVLGLTSRETADLTKKSHDVGRDVLGKPGITKRIFVESHDVGRDVLGLKGLRGSCTQKGKILYYWA